MGARTQLPSKTGPVEIGIILTGVSNAKAFGVSAENTVNEKDVDNAAIKEINAEGGLAGRKVVPVYASTDTGDSSWDADYAAACDAIVIQTYYGDVAPVYPLLRSLPVRGLGLDFVAGREGNLSAIRDHGFPEGKLLVAGLLDGKGCEDP